MITLAEPAKVFHLRQPYQREVQECEKARSHDWAETPTWDPNKDPQDHEDKQKYYGSGSTLRCECECESIKQVTIISIVQNIAKTSWYQNSCEQSSTLRSPLHGKTTWRRPLICSRSSTRAYSVQGGRARCSIPYAFTRNIPCKFCTTTVIIEERIRGPPIARSKKALKWLSIRRAVAGLLLHHKIIINGCVVWATCCVT